MLAKQASTASRNTVVAPSFSMQLATVQLVCLFWANNVFCVCLCLHSSHQQSLEKNPSQRIPSSTSPHDVAALLRQFLRELPDLLLTNTLSPVFLSAVALSGSKERSKCVLLTTLLLPSQHLLCTQVSKTACREWSLLRCCAHPRTCILFHSKCAQGWIKQKYYPN